MRKAQERSSITSFFRRKELEKVDLLCVYGFLEEVLIASKKWREEKKERLLIFIEEDLDCLQPFLQKKEAAFILEDPQVEICQLQTPLQLEPLLKKICWKTLFMQKECVAFKKHAKKKRFQEFSSLMEKISLGVELSFAAYSDFGLLSFSNTYRNLLQTKAWKDYGHLEGAFSKIPAIVCGASPSLKQQLPLLKKMKDNALIFSGGSSLNVFSAHNIPFHFAASVDKEAPYERFKMQSAWEIPFFYQNQISPLNFSLVHAPLIGVKGYSSLPLERWWEEHLGFSQDPFEGGWTVATFLLSLAAFLGCDPIIMVGMDFSFHQTPYASGVVEEKTRNRELLSVQDRKGKGVWTQRDWLLARSWIEDFAKKNSHLTIIDANLGLSFEGVRKSSFPQVVKKITKSWDLSALVHGTLARVATSSLPRQELLPLFKELEESLKEVEMMVEKEIERGKKKESFSFEKIEAKLERKMSYRLLLDPLWKIWSPLFEKNASLQQIALHRFLFLKRVAKEHREMIERVRG